jgi:hypothetical protein
MKRSSMNLLKYMVRLCSLISLQIINMNTFAKTTAHGVPITVPIICKKKRFCDVVTLCFSTSVSALMIKSRLSNGMVVCDSKNFLKSLMPSSIGIEG